MCVLVFRWCISEISTPTVPVDVDGIRVGTPHSETLLDDLLDFGEIGLQSLMAEHFGKYLKLQKEIIFNPPK